MLTQYYKPSKKKAIGCEGCTKERRITYSNSRYQEIQFKAIACALKLKGLEDLLGEKIWGKAYQEKGRAFVKITEVEKSMADFGDSHICAIGVKCT